MNLCRSLGLWISMGSLLLCCNLLGCRKSNKGSSVERREPVQPKPRITPEQRRLRAAFKSVRSLRNVNGFTITQTLGHWRKRSLALAKANKGKAPSPYEWSGVCPSSKRCRVKIAFSDGSFKNRIEVLWDVVDKKVTPANPVAMMLLNPKLAQPRKPAVRPKPRKKPKTKRRFQRRRRYRRREQRRRRHRRIRRRQAQ